MDNIKGAVPLETAALYRRWRSYAMYLFLVVCSMYAYFVVAVTALINQVSRKKTDQERRNNGTNITAIQQNSGATVAVTKSIFFSVVA